VVRDSVHVVRRPVISLHQPQVIDQYKAFDKIGDLIANQVLGAAVGSCGLVWLTLCLKDGISASLRQDATLLPINTTSYARRYYSEVCNLVVLDFSPQTQCQFLYSELKRKWDLFRRDLGI
jgi:hypothetical protein